MTVDELLARLKVMQRNLSTSIAIEARPKTLNHT
jgi:hypothetical protein